MGTVVFPAHFYNALRQKPNSIKPWPMMDEVIALHGEDRVFVGGPPKTILDSWKQICLMLGYSPQQYAKNRRSFKPVVSKNGPRGLKETSPIFEIFHEVLRGNGSMAFTLHNIEELLNEQAKDAALASNPTSKNLRREWATKHRLTAIQLLEALLVSIKQDEPKLMFDYFKMHAQSVAMLRALRRELNEDLKKWFGGPMYLEDESQLPYVGLYVVMAACGTMQSSEQMGITDAGSRMLEKSGRVLKEFVEGRVIAE